MDSQFAVAHKNCNPGLPGYSASVSESIKITFQQKATRLDFSITECKKALEVISKFNLLQIKLDEFERDLFQQWTIGIDKRVEENLKLCLLTRNAKELQVNFNQEASISFIMFFYLTN